MKIDRVTYRRLVTGENYSNKAVEASAQVEPGEDPAAVLRDLALWVGDRLTNTRNATPDLVALREEVETAAETAEYWDGIVRRQQESLRKLREEERRQYARMGCLDAYLPDLDNIPF